VLSDLFPGAEIGLCWGRRAIDLIACCVWVCVTNSVLIFEIVVDTSCILAWLIEEGYEVYAFMADVGQEEV